MMKPFLTTLKILGAVLLLALVLWITWATRLSNADDVQMADGVYFVDQDCYSRMMRAFTPGLLPLPGEMSAAEFENFPDGVRQHTTWPMDGAIRLVNLFTPSPELAGAWVSPVLGLGAVLFLGIWVWRLRLRDGWMTLVLVAISPILAMGTVFGRPDHQSLLMFFLTIALAAELALQYQEHPEDRTNRRGWQVIGGLAWGFAFWTSLYEPTFLFVIVLVLNLIIFRDSLTWARRKFFVIPFVILLVPTLIEAWPITLPGSGPGQEYFANWSQSIPELRGYGLSLIFGGAASGGASLTAWVGFGLILAPWLFAAGWVVRRDRLILWTALLVLIVVCLAMWQIRWAFFAVLIYALSLPWQMRALPRGWIAGLVFVLPLLWPVAAHWEKILYPDSQQAVLVEQQRNEQKLIRGMALEIREESGINANPDDAAIRAQGILAPWWMSPSMAWWSGLPTVAGSSHQSLPGTADTFRFYSTTDRTEAAEILRDRQIHWVIAEDPERVLPMATQFFAGESAGKADRTAANIEEAVPGVQEVITIDGERQATGSSGRDSLAVALYEGRGGVPPYLVLQSENAYYKLYRVDYTRMPRITGEAEIEE